MEQSRYLEDVWNEGPPLSRAELRAAAKFRQAMQELLERLRGKRTLRWEQVMSLCPTHGERITPKRRERSFA